VLTKLPASNAAYLTGHSFFPSLISAPFHAGLSVAFDFAIAACVVAAIASLLRGKHYVHDLHSESVTAAREAEARVSVAEAPGSVAEDSDRERAVPALDQAAPELDPATS
jgi:hypothetical protein